MSEQGLSPLERRVQDPVDRQRLLLRRVEGLIKAPAGSYEDAESAKKLWANLVLLTGYGPAAEEPDYTAFVAKALASLRVLRPDDEGCAKGAAALEQVVAECMDSRTGIPFSKVSRAMTPRLVWLARKPGALISEGTVCLLAGQGGVAKTTLALQLALHIAGNQRRTEEDDKEAGFSANSNDSDACGGLEGVGGSVLYLTYEDALNECGSRLNRMIEHQPGAAQTRTQAALRHVIGMRMKGRPLFGVPAGVSFNARPSRRPGWQDLVRAIDTHKPVLVIIDPVLCAYVGDSNAVGPVREFLDALSDLAEEKRFGVLCVAHSNKAARRSADDWDPGHIGGSAAWVDGTRATVILAAREGRPFLRVPKANWGPMFVEAELRVRRATSGAILGFEMLGDWVHSLSEGYTEQSDTALKEESSNTTLQSVNGNDNSQEKHSAFL